MNKVYINLYTQSSGKKRIFRIVIGLAYLILAILKMTSEWEDFSAMDYFIMSGFLIVGLIYFFSALEIRSINLIDPYLLIDEEKVILKKSSFDKEIIHFENMEQVKINHLSADFAYKDASYKTLGLGLLNAENLSLVKQRLERLN